jgi:glutamate synthase domain-containing protein 3
MRVMTDVPQATDLSDRVTYTEGGKVATVDAAGVYYRELNSVLRQIVDGPDSKTERVVLQNVVGQRYIASDLDRPVTIEIHGTPGNDLAALMNGQTVVVHGNAQDGCGNTMNAGEVVVHGHAGDILGMSMRGGTIYVRDYVGYRVGIHMKEYQDKIPALVIGGTAQDFLGEYMAGGRVVVFGLDLREGEPHHANLIGTGIHNGLIYIRGRVEDHQFGREVGVVKPGEAMWEDADWQFLRKCAEGYVSHFGGSSDDILAGEFRKLYAKYLRPYGPLYTWRN